MFPPKNGPMAVWCRKVDTGRNYVAEILLTHGDYQRSEAEFLLKMP